MRLYLAGPLFTSAERAWNVSLCDILTVYGFKSWLPQANEPRDRTAPEIFKKDVAGIDWADAVLANMDGPDPDSGTAWECGYAYAKGKPVFTYRTDFRGIQDGQFAPFNLMLSESSTVIKVGSEIYHVADEIAKALKRYEGVRKCESSTESRFSEQR